MRKNKTITITNDLPHLLEAVWSHKDCPKWLQDVIWEGVTERVDALEMSATFWASQLESARPDDPIEQEMKYGDYLPGDDLEALRLRVIQGGVK